MRIDDTGATDLPGLFACGEVVWGLHGACRKGGNALAECLVFDRLAGLHAAGALPVGPPDETISENSSTAMDGSALRELRRNLKAIAWKHDGLFELRTDYKRVSNAWKTCFPASVGCQPIRRNACVSARIY